MRNREEYVDFRSDETKIYFDAYASTAAKPIKGRTKTEYWKIIGTVCKEMGKDFLDFKEEDAVSWQNRLEDKIRRGKLAVPTLRLRTSCCDNFASYLRQTGVMEVNPFACLVRPDVNDTPFSDKIPRTQECDDILGAAEAEGMDMFMIITFVLRMALTNADICDIETANVKYVDGDVVLYFYAPGSKNEKRYLVVPDDIKDMVSNYHKMVTTKYLFANAWGKKMTSAALMKRVRKVMANAGTPQYTLKDLRNRAIYQMIHGGAETEDVARYANISMQRVHTFEESPLVASAMLSSCPANLTYLKMAEM